MARVEIGGKALDVLTRDELSATFEEWYQLLGEVIANPKGEVPVDLLAGTTIPAVPLTYNYLDLGGPKFGWLWDVMRLAINGADPTATVTGNVWAFVADRAPTASNTIDVYPQLVEIGNGTIPNSAFYGRQQTILRPGQRIILGIKSIPASTVINGSGLAIQYRDPSAGIPANTLRRPR